MCLFLSILLSVFSNPSSDLLVSVSTWLKLSMLISCSSYSAWNRFFNSSLKAFSVYELFSFAKIVSNRCCFSSPRFVFRSFKDTVATTNTRSLPLSAPRFALTSCSDLLHFWFIITWSIWLTFLWSGDLHVVLWISLCINSVPPMTSLLSTHRSGSLSPLLLAHPKPCAPMALCFPVLSSPSLALMSPITISTSWRGVVRISSSSCSYNSSFYSSSASSVGA